MRITQEADYALRIVCCLAEQEGLVDANTIAEQCCVSQQFALKILRKLMLGSLVKSHKGANGGYRLERAPEEITMRNVIELIDGEIFVSRCLSVDHACSKQGEHKRDCIIHCIFDAINRDIVAKLDKVRISSLIDGDLSAEDIIKNF